MKDVLEIPRTAMEVFEMLPEGTLCEVIDNALYMSPSPTIDHQDIVGDIFGDLRAAIKAGKTGKAYVSPSDVYLDNGETVVQPDVLAVRAERLGIVERKGVIGSPDLVVEVLSKNARYDKETKLKVYERNGVPEYIIIDPDTKEVWQYLLADGVYALQPGSAPGKFTTSQFSVEINF